MPQTTLSALPRVAICPGSAALDHVKTRDVPGSALGHALHEVQDRRAKGLPLDLDAIAERHAVPADDRGWYFATARRCLPVIPAGALSEQAFAYWRDDGSVIAIGPPNAAHEYEEWGADMFGTLDLIWSEPHPLTFSSPPRNVDTKIPGAHCPPGSTLVVADYKSGTDDNVPPPDRNWQLRAGALMAARWTGATRVIPAICYLEPPPEGETRTGRWEMGTPIDAAGLNAIEAELRDVLHRVETARFDVAAGAVPELVTGDHCTHCPARTGCPAHLAEVRAMVTGTLSTLCLIGAPLTREEAEHIANRLPSIKAVVAKAEEALKLASDIHGPLTLTSGKVYEGKDEERSAIDAGIAIPVLIDQGYPDPVTALSTSRALIRDMISADFRARGIKGAAAKTREVYAAIDAAGGITRSTVRVYKARHGGKVLPVACGTPELEDLGLLED